MCDVFQDGQPHLFTDIECRGSEITFELGQKTSLKEGPLVSWVVPPQYRLTLFVGDAVYLAEGTLTENNEQPIADAEYFMVERNNTLANSALNSTTSSCGTTYTETQNITIIVILSLVLLTILGFAVGYYLMSKRQEEKQNRLLAKVDKLKRFK